MLSRTVTRTVFALLAVLAPQARTHAETLAYANMDEKAALDAAGPGRDQTGERAAPSNDACASVKVISTLPFSELVDTSAATPDSPPGSCNTGTATTMQNSVWYRWTAPEHCTATFQAADVVNYDVIVTAYQGSSCAALIEIACADEPEPATVVFNAVKNTVYWFKVGDWGLQAGGGQTQVTLTTALPNDTCATATPISTVDITTSVNISVAQAGAGITNCGFPGSTQTQNDIWYTFTAASACTVSVTLTPTGFDAILALYWNHGGCNVLVGASCGHSTQAQTRTIQLDAGESAAIRIGAYSASPGGGPVQMTFSARAVNDECAGALLLPCNSVADVHLQLGSNSVGEPVYSCPPVNQGTGFNSLWYRFIPTGPNVRLRTYRVPGGPGDTRLGVYSGSCGSLTEIGCNDDMNSGPDPFMSKIELSGLSTQQQYYVRVSAFEVLDIGSYRLSLECPPDCAACPQGSVPEAEACGDNTNAGCGTNPPSYQDIALGATICGTSWLQPQGATLIGDYDAYRVNIPAAGTLTWTVTAQFEPQISMLAPGCPGGALTTVAGAACSPVIVAFPVTPGQMILSVRPLVGASTPPFGCDTLSKYRAVAVFSPRCPGDFNGDGQINTADLTLLLLKFGTAVPPGTLVDMNYDGDVNTEDLTRLLVRFGLTCP